MVSGLPTDRFVVEGFLPRKGAERRRRVAALLADERTTVVLEAPGRLAATLEELAAVDPERPVAVVRELTKVHEEVWRGTLADGRGRVRRARGARRGRAGGRRRSGAGAGRTTTRVEAAGPRRLAEDPAAGPRQVADRVAATLGVARRRAYEAALRLRERRDGVRKRLRPPVRYRRCPPTT